MKSISDMPFEEYEKVARNIAYYIKRSKYHQLTLSQLAVLTGRSVRFLNAYLEGRDDFILNVAMKTDTGIYNLDIASYIVEYSPNEDAGC